MKAALALALLPIVSASPGDYQVQAPFTVKTHTVTSILGNTGQTMQTPGQDAVYNDPVNYVHVLCFTFHG